MAEDSIKRKKDAVGEPVGNGGPGSFAKAGPNTEAAGVDLTPVNIGPVIIQVNGLPFKLSERREIEPAYPEGLPTAEVTFDFGDEDGTTYTHVNIGGDEGEEGVSLTVWMQDGERCDSTESEEHGYDEDTMYDLIRWAHGVNDNVESNIAGYLNTMSPEVEAAIVAVATGAPATVTRAKPIIDFDAPNIDELTDQQVYKMLNAIIARTGLISPVIDQDEALYRLFEGRAEPKPDRNDAEAAVDKETDWRIDYLQHRLGGQEQLARRVTETQAWAELEEVMIEALADPKQGTAAKVVKAIDEIYDAG